MEYWRGDLDVPQVQRLVSEPGLRCLIRTNCVVMSCYTPQVLNHRVRMAMQKQSEDSSKLPVPMNENAAELGDLNLSVGELRSLHGFAEPASPPTIPPRASMDPAVAEVHTCIDLPCLVVLTLPRTGCIYNVLTTGLVWRSWTMCTLSRRTSSINSSTSSNNEKWRRQDRYDPRGWATAHPPHLPLCPCR